MMPENTSYLTYLFFVGRLQKQHVFVYMQTSAGLLGGRIIFFDLMLARTIIGIGIPPTSPIIIGQAARTVCMQTLEYDS